VRAQQNDAACWFQPSNNGWNQQQPAALTPVNKRPMNMGTHPPQANLSLSASKVLARKVGESHA